MRTNELSKKVKKTLTGMIVLVFTISMVGLTGCSSAGPVTGNTESTKGTDPAASIETTALGATESTAQNTSKETAVESGNTSNGSEADPDKSMEKYINLLGLSKDELIKALDETPDSTDEGGLEFKKADIRVWFEGKDIRTVSQVFTQRKDIDFKGAKIGDKLDKFKEAFGKPVSDANGDAHFKYEDLFLSINYDTGSGETFAVYLLEKDF